MGRSVTGSIKRIPYEAWPLASSLVEHGQLVFERDDLEDQILSGFEGGNGGNQ